MGLLGGEVGGEEGGELRPEKEIGGIWGDFKRDWNTAKRNFKYYIFALETSNNCNYDGNIIKNPKKFDLLPCTHGQERMGLRCCILGAWCWLVSVRC